VSAPRVLIAGIGNVFLGDDAFGCEVARCLAARPRSARVEVQDFGIRGLDLAYALHDGYDLVILVDAVQRGDPPGTVHIVEPVLPDGPGGLEMHRMDPVAVLRLAVTMGGALPLLRLVSCEVATLEPAEDELPCLSKPVRAAVDAAVGVIEGLLAEYLGAAHSERA
jgi:hydrogenase maturation protease